MIKYCVNFLAVLVLITVMPFTAMSATIIVDKFGTGLYKTIQSGINAAATGDTVVVYPGEYTGQVIVNKNILLQGSGYEYTIINVNADPALSMSTGIVRWFSISSQIGNGVSMSGGLLENCILRSSPKKGITYNGTSAVVQNCVAIDNQCADGGNQIWATSDGLSVINTIVFTCPDGNYSNDWVGGYWVQIGVLYCRTYGTQGVGGISDNPQFISCQDDYKLQPTSPCINKGKPDTYDPDGTRSDIGYYGGTNTPVFPVVTNLSVTINPDGTVRVQGTAQSRY